MLLGRRGGPDASGWIAGKGQAPMSTKALGVVPSWRALGPRSGTRSRSGKEKGGEDETRTAYVFGGSPMARGTGLGQFGRAPATCSAYLIPSLRGRSNITRTGILYKNNRVREGRMSASSKAKPARVNRQLINEDLGDGNYRKILVNFLVRCSPPHPQSHEGRYLLITDAPLEAQRIADPEAPRNWCGRSRIVSARR
ncbi:hypothetical protein GQ53DRAFT_768145 [Thozetella sp. PMI_491]|nr:hypothetical protein GQ53DRAFT_768145 [Thozetella sp. PMI_491]